MDKQIKLMRHPRFMGYSLLLSMLVLSFASCKRAEDAVNHIYIQNATELDLDFQIVRHSVSNIPGRENSIPAGAKVIIGGGALHLSGPNIVFKTINENFGLATDTVEILHNGEVIIKWGGPLRVMEPGTNHFYNENSWHAETGGFRCRYEHATFTIYESDLPPKGGNLPNGL